jgi:large conductance mechanosensitive channel
MLKGFRDFILRGNVIDLAVAVIIGAAFTSIVNSLVADIINPLIAAIVGKPDFSALTLTINGGVIKYGNFLNAAISFFLMAVVVYFFIVLPINALLLRLRGPAPTSTKPCPQCLGDNALGATRCKFCTQTIPA